VWFLEENEGYLGGWTWVPEISLELEQASELIRSFDTVRLEWNSYIRVSNAIRGSLPFGIDLG
jgi:hypothetical protein